MKYFEDAKRKNYVDSNNVVVGFELPLSQQVCSPKSELRHLDGSKAYPIEVADDTWVFDPTFCERGRLPEDEYGNEYREAKFKLTNGVDIVFLVLSNYHNGYYALNFTGCGVEGLL
jgi:hypothetical protein